MPGSDDAKNHSQDSSTTNGSSSLGLASTRKTTLLKKCAQEGNDRVDALTAATDRSANAESEDRLLSWHESLVSVTNATSSLEVEEWENDDNIDVLCQALQDHCTISAVGAQDTLPISGETTGA